MEERTVLPRMHAVPVDALAAYLAAARRNLDDPYHRRWPHRRATARIRLAVFLYAAGGPLDEVVDLVTQAIDAYREVLADRPSLSELSTPHDGEYVDYWIGASSVTAGYLHWALALGRTDLLPPLTDHLWDPAPPAVPLVHPELRLAYALREVLVGSPEAALAELARIPRSARIDPRRRAAVLAALARGSGQDLVTALAALGRGHRRATADPGDPHAPERLLCLAGAGAAGLAVDRGLITLDDLPPGIDSLPDDLLRFVRG